jgi:hypothetical protein
VSKEENKFGFHKEEIKEDTNEQVKNALEFQILT